jgi:hypothetical protein
MMTSKLRSSKDQRFRLTSDNCNLGDGMLGRVQDFVVHKWQGKAQGRHMIIELGNIHAKWKLLIENTCMLLANGKETMWDSKCMDVLHTNKGKTNYMEEIDVAKLNGQGTETAKPVTPRTDLVTSTKPILPTDPSYPLDPAL